MLKFERVLATGSRELPQCRCSSAMNLLSIVPVPEGDSEIHIFRCSDCNHELRLTVWNTESLAQCSSPAC
jgi:hypothetical protein